jgi:putative membrane protein
VEARQIWGRILIAARALTSQVINYLPEDGDGFERKLFVQRLIAFVYALTHQLRGTDPADDLARYLPRRKWRSCAACTTSRWRCWTAAFDAVRAGRKRGAGEPLLWILDAQVSELAAAVGGCERISQHADSVCLRRAATPHRLLYCFMLPFGLVADLGMATPLVCVFVAYTLFALEAIAGNLRTVRHRSELPRSQCHDAQYRTLAAGAVRRRDAGSAATVRAL